MKTQALFLALFSSALFLIFSCKKNMGMDESPLEARTVTVKKAERNINLETYGSVTYKKKYDVTALAEGTIVELFVQEGSEVKKGDLLLRLKNIQYEIEKVERQNALNSARAKVRAALNNIKEKEKSARARLLELENLRSNLAQKKEEARLLKKNFEKNERLFSAGGISESAFEQIKVQMKSALTEIGVLEKQLAMQEMGYRDQDLLEAGLVASESPEERAAQLVELNLQSAKIDLELCETEARNAEQSLKSIESLLESLDIRAPADGLVAALNKESGERLLQNEKALTIIDMKEPFAIASAQEKDAEKIQAGSPALVRIESLALEQESRVAFISPLADSETGNFSVKIPLKNGDGRIKFGMFAECSIKTRATGSYFELPESAVIKRRGNSVAFYCVENGYVFEKECPVATEKDGKIFLEKGIEDGEIILVEPSPSIKEGSHVKAI